MAKTVRDSNIIEVIAQIVANCEADLVESVEGLQAAHDGTDATNEFDRESRQKTIKEVVRAQLDGDLDTVWLQEVASERLANPEDAAAYVDLSEAEWHEQQTTWAENYRKAGVEGDHSDRQLADAHVRRKFDVPIEEFEREVVDWDASEALKMLLGGNLDRCIGTINQIADDLEENES
jgi:hypothetical protein